MANSVSHRINLPVGFISNGEIFDYVEVTPMTGRVRKKLGKPEVRQNPIQGIDYVFDECVQSIAGQTFDDPSILKDLTSADRDHIVMKLREISMGEIVTFDFNCPNCSEPLSAKININEDIDVDILSDEERESMADYDGNRFVFSVSSSDSDKEFSMDFDATFQIPTGRHQELVFSGRTDQEQSNPIEDQYDLYYYSLITWNGEPKEELDFNPFDDCVVDVIDYISSKFESSIPGPDFSLQIKCSECENEVPADLGSSDFLLPTNQNERS